MTADLKGDPEEIIHANLVRDRKTLAKSYGSFIICMIIVLIFIASLIGIFVYQYYVAQNMREPALSIEPKADNNLIYIDARSDNSLKAVESQLENFFKGYQQQSASSYPERNYTQCDYSHEKGPGQFCIVNPSIYPCISENRYGFTKRSPCVFLKIDNGLKWTPECYNTTENLPSDMPQALTDFIFKEKNRNSKLLNKIWISCKGESPEDEDNIKLIKYYPTKGFPAYYFPKETLDTLSPIIAVHFENPKLGVLLNVECRIWAKNIIKDKISFKLLVE